MASPLTLRDGRWFLDDAALTNGTVVEIRCDAPDLWLPVWVEGLPEIPMGCIRILRSGRLVRVPLFDPESRLRRPTHGTDPELLGASARRQLETGRRSALLYTDLVRPKPNLARALEVLAVQDRGLAAFVRFVFTLVYPKEVAALNEEHEEI